MVQGPGRGEAPVSSQPRKFDLAFDDPMASSLMRCRPLVTAVMGRMEVCTMKSTHAAI